MEKQKKWMYRLSRKKALTLLAGICLAFLANAQPKTMNPTGENLVGTSDKYVDYTVPQNTPGLLYIEARGADGGTTGSTDRDKHAGKGATIEGWLNIGTGAGKIPVGSTIRFMVGHKGECNQKYNGKSYDGCGGGGGTAVAFQKPGDDAWYLLIVAGGGGGAGQSYTGRQGEIAGNGSNGKNSWGRKNISGGKNGNEGDKGTAYGGGGAFASQDNTRGLAGFSEVTNEPEGGGGDGKEVDAPGVYGFGGGGFGVEKNGYFSGGGGGGYSGGGGGANGGGGGGGGSYSNDTYVFAPFKTINGNTGHPADGYVKYRFTTKVAIRNQGKCLHAANSTGNGSNVKVSDCGNADATKWLIEGSYIKSNQGKCLDLAYNKTDNGTNIRLWDCNGSNAQRWIYDGLSKQIRNLGNWKKCLDRENNGNIRIWDCRDTAGQQWKIDGATTAKGNNRVKTVYLAEVPDQCLTLWGHGAYTSNGTDTEHLDCTDHASQKWLFDGINIRYYAQQNKCLDLDHNNTKNGTNIQLWDCNGSDAQHWVYDGITNTIRYWNKPDKCLTVSGTFVVIEDCNGHQNQLWRLKDAKTPFGPDKVKSISRLNHKEKCMDVYDKRTASGTNIQLGDCTGNTNQQWTYDGLYLKYKKDPTKCLDLKSGNTHKGTNIQLWPCTGGKAQRWLYDEVNHRIRYADNWNRCLEVYRDDNNAGTNIQIYDCRDTDAQRWIMK